MLLAQLRRLFSSTLPPAPKSLERALVTSSTIRGAIGIPTPFPSISPSTLALRTLTPVSALLVAPVSSLQPTLAMTAVTPASIAVPPRLSILGVLAGTSITGTAGVNSLKGTAGADMIFGLDGNDTISGGIGDDFLDGGAGDDILDGGVGNDRLLGGDGNDALSGGVGDDVLDGGAGDDILNGGAGNDLLLGGDGNDTLSGGVGDDVLDGGNGNDTLDGGVGANRLIGGSGDDLYVVYSTLDHVVEMAGGGTDTVRSSVSWVLGDHLEALVLTGVQDLNGTGTSLNNLLVGNSGSNQLFGLDGDDVVQGGVGADTLDGGGGADRFVYVSQEDTATDAADLAGMDTILGLEAVDIVDLSGFTGLDPDSFTMIQHATGDGTPNDFMLSWTSTKNNGSPTTNYVLLVDAAPLVSLRGPGGKTAIFGILAEDAAQTSLNGTFVTGDGASASFTTPTNLTGTYGTFGFDTTTGAWTYTLANGSPTVQGLITGATVTDTLTVQGSSAATWTLTMNISGANDAAIFSGTSTGNVQEDGTVITGGTLAVSDVDSGQSSFASTSDLSGIYGNFTFNLASGVWNYTLDYRNIRVQALATGQTVTDTLTVTSADGTSHAITVSIAGADGLFDFENGLLGWNTLGSVITATSPDAPGKSALLEGGNALPAQIETFLNVTPGSLVNIGGNDIHSGSAMKTTISLDAGERVSFNWRFIAEDGMPYNDVSFVRNINEELELLSRVSIVGDYGDSGWQQSSFTAPTAGNYEIGFGAMNYDDNVASSKLYIDNFSILDPI